MTHFWFFFSCYRNKACTFSTVTSPEDSEKWRGVEDDARRLRFDTFGDHTSSRVRGITPLGPGPTPPRMLSYLRCLCKPPFMSAGCSDLDLVWVYHMVHSDYPPFFFISVPFQVSLMFFFFVCCSFSSGLTYSIVFLVAAWLLIHCVDFILGL